MRKRTVCLTVLALLWMPLATSAQRRVMVFDPELREPVGDVMVWADHGDAVTTNVFGEATIPEKFDTLTVSKAGYIALRIPARWMEDSIPIIRDYNSIGEVTVYGTGRPARVQKAVDRWTKEERTEYELRHPITGIGFNMSDLFSPKQARFKRNRKKLEKIFRRLDAEESDPIIQTYREVMGTKGKKRP